MQIDSTESLHLRSATRLVWDRILFECELAMLGITSERQMTNEQVREGLSDMRDSISWL